MAAMNTLKAEADLVPFDRAVEPGRATLYRFGEFELDPALFELRCQNGRLPIAPKVFDLLLYLIENRHRVLTHADLRAALWPGVTVTDASLTYSVMAARRALGDTGRTQVFIRNVRGRGYQFAAVVQPRATPASGFIGR